MNIFKNLFKKPTPTIPEDETGLVWMTINLKTKEKNHYSSYEEMCEKTTLDPKTTRNFLGQWLSAKNKSVYFVDLV